MKHGIYYAYWESEWAADYKYYVEKVARLGFDILEIGVGPIADYSQTEIKELRKCADDNGIILTGGYGPTFNHNMGSSDPKIKAEALDWYKRTFDVMGELDMHWLGGKDIATREKIERAKEQVALRKVIDNRTDEQRRLDELFEKQLRGE